MKDYGIQHSLRETNTLKLLEEIMEPEWDLLIFKVPDNAPLDFQKRHGVFGASFFQEKEGTPQAPEECSYGSTIEEALLKAIKQWEEER